MSDIPLHDLVIRHIAEYLWGNNSTLTALMRVSKRFYALRDIFYSQICLDRYQSPHFFKKNPHPYGWNIVRCMTFNNETDITDANISMFSSVHELEFFNCRYLKLYISI